jgi:fused signal recognition particle receptor
MSKGFFKSLMDRFSGRPVDWDEVEESLLRADLGVSLSMRILDILQERWGIGAELAARLAKEQVREVLLDPPTFPEPTPQLPVVALIVGVNGTGKTTSSAKLAGWLRQHGHTCLLAAADTFRAAAIEQLQLWGDRLDVPVVSGEYGADPAALCFDAWAHARARGIEYLLCDTAGRLHTKDNLMRELEKISRILAKHDPSAPSEKLLVVDATTGSNAVVQAREFHKAIGLTGIILTKLDGSGRGGVAAAIAEELEIPTRFIGSGEKIGDFRVFNPDDFAEEMF